MRIIGLGIAACMLGRKEASGGLTPHSPAHERGAITVMRAVVLLLGAALIGCGDRPDWIIRPNAGSGGGSDAGGGGAGGSGGAGAASLGGGGRMAGTAGRGGAAAAGSSSAGSSGGALAEQPLVPLVPGRVSNYAFRPIDDTRPMTGTCAEPTTWFASGEGLFEGEEGTLYATFCALEPVLLQGQGDDLIGYKIRDGMLVGPKFAHILSPVQDGAMWASGTGDHFTWWEVPEPVVTPAGTFTACFHRDGTDTRMTYCRGLGLVQAFDFSGNYQLDLIAKNF